MNNIQLIKSGLVRRLFVEICPLLTETEAKKYKKEIFGVISEIRQEEIIIEFQMILEKKGLIIPKSNDEGVKNE